MSKLAAVYLRGQTDGTPPEGTICLALLELAHNANSQEPLKANVIASRQDIANRYLEEILALLRQAGIVMSHRGAGGGYLLARRPAEITVWEVFVCLQGDTIVKDTSLCSAGNLSKMVLLDIWAPLKTESVREGDWGDRKYTKRIR